MTAKKLYLKPNFCHRQNYALGCPEKCGGSMLSAIDSSSRQKEARAPQRSLRLMRRKIQIEQPARFSRYKVNGTAKAWCWPEVCPENPCFVPTPKKTKIPV